MCVLLPALSLYRCQIADSAPLVASSGFCGNSLVNGGSLSTTTTNAPKLCPNSQTVTCGGAAGLQLYRNSAVLDAALNIIPGSGSPAPASTTSVSAAAPVASGGASSSTGGGFVNGACIAEIDQRLLKGPKFTSTQMTPGACSSYCANLGYTYAGVEYGSGASAFYSASSDPAQQLTLSLLLLQSATATTSSRFPTLRTSATWVSPCSPCLCRRGAPD